MNIVVFDCETTGLSHETDSIVELATVLIEGPPWNLADTFSSLVRPTSPIGIGAVAAHHIREVDVADARPLNDVAAASHIPSADVMAAHNAAFDFGFFLWPGPWVCTYRVARQLWPDAPGYKNMELRYFLPGLDDEIRKSTEIMALPPHRALPDAFVTACVLRRMLAEHDIDELIRLTSAPILIKTVGFGKHFGMRWEDVPKDYLRWVASKDFDADVLYTARHWLGGVR